MGTGEGLRRAGDEPVQRPAERPGEHGCSHRHRHRLVCHHATDEGREEPTDEHLPGSADVEQARLEADTNGQTREDQRTGRNQGIVRAWVLGTSEMASDAVLPSTSRKEIPGAFKQGLVGLEREQKVELSL